jgi:osmoprotectant transport system ATP-binding protein
MSASIELEGVEKRFDGLPALAIDRLLVPERTTLALIGPSGCGKSTLLRLVVGLIRPDRGRILVGETPMGPETRALILPRVGYVIQDGGLFPHLTAEENVSLVAGHRRWTRARVAARLEELLELTGLDRALLARYPTQLSGGQKQRVALMRALMLDPDVLLMDEPLAELDPMIRSRLQRDLRDVFRRLRKTVLFVTHDLAEAAVVADEIVLLRSGRIVQRGAPADLVARPADPFVTEFLAAQLPPETLGWAAR